MISGLGPGCLRYSISGIGMSFKKPSTASGGSANTSAVGDGATFLSLAKETNYGSVLEENMQFDIYLHRGGMRGNFHDSIVVSTFKYGSVTLELSKCETEKRIVPKCVHFQGVKEDLVLKKTVQCTFQNLAEVAMEILLEMGDYDLFTNNCQSFCNFFLKALDAPQYKTTAREAAETLTTGTGAGALIYGAQALLSGKK